MLVFLLQVGKEDEAKQEEEAFAAEDIDQILAGRTEKRQIGNRKGNTFSTATFGASNDVLVGSCNSSCCILLTQRLPMYMLHVAKLMTVCSMP